MPDRTPDLDRAPRIVLLYGSNRERSFSRLLAQEAARLLRRCGAETRLFDPSGLPLPDDAADSHPKVQTLREWVQWSEGQVWCSPEHHGSFSAVLKAQLDWLPLTLPGVHPTRGKALALLQVCGGAQSFNTVNQLRLVGRALHMFTAPHQLSVPEAFREFDEAGRMRPSPLRDRLVDVMDELVELTVLLRDRSERLAEA